MLEINFEPFPTLTTERLVIRQITKEDEEELFLMRSNLDIMRFIPRPIPKTVGEISLLLQMMSEGMTKGERINWGIALKENNKLIGHIGFVHIYKENHRAEVGYLLQPAYHGTGIMREALIAVLKYGFDNLKLHSIEALVRPENYPSRKLLEKTGFVQEGYFVENLFWNNRYEDTVVYSLLAKNFKLN